VIEWDGGRYLSAYVSLAMAYFQIGDVAHTLKKPEHGDFYGPEYV